jgi:hypothetical protein
MSELEPSRRISDADRERVAEILREAAGDGRIDLGELEQRLEAAYAAKTYGDLAPITHDLAPAPGSWAPGVPGPKRERAVAVMGSLERRGPWVVPEEFHVVCFMGSAELDVREARFSAPETTLTVTTFLGGATIIVNPSTDVVVHGVGIMGSYSAPSPEPPAHLIADSPVLHVRGVAIMGGVNVVRRPMPGEDKTPGWRYRH